MNTQPSNPQHNFIVSDISFVEPRFPQYDFQYLLAEGSMGASYKVIQKKLQRKVALKVIARRIGREQTFSDAFEDHAVASAKLNHPNLVQLYDFGETEEMLYMVSEYVSGTTLERAANGSPIDPKQVLKIMSEVCSGMAHAHKHDIVHGDLQPATILINAELEPKISDFGLAMSLRSQGAFRTAPLSPHFTAPEVFFGDTHGDRLTDVYSLGAIMYYLLTAIPYEAEVPRASSVSTCDERFDAVISKAMHEDRLHRYESVQELLADIEQLKLDPPKSDSGPNAAAYITPLAAAQNQTVRVVKRPQYHAQLNPSNKLNFPKAG